MENQMNDGNQNTQQIGQNSVSQPAMTPERPKANYLMIGGIVLACFVVFGFGGYYLGKQSSNSQQSLNNRQNQLRTSPVFLKLLKFKEFFLFLKSYRESFEKFLST